MPKQADIKFQQGKWVLTGELDFSNVMLLYEKSLLGIKESLELRFDFSQLMASNSAGLALIIEWIKLAKRHAKPIHFEHLPPKLIAIAKVAGMLPLIPD